MQLPRLTLGFCVLVAMVAGAAPAYSAEPVILPRSILILPPTNRSVEVNAPYIFLSTITRPLAEKGYYVFPVAVIDRFMRENGLQISAEMHAIPLAKLREHIHPDAVLYVDILDWGQKYQILTSKAVVSANLKLVDAHTGNVIWENRAYASESPNNSGNNGLAGMLIQAVADQVIGSLSDKTYELSRVANNQAVDRLPDGPIRLEVQTAKR
ncbi:MAG: DUF799 family lipoprotein [Marinagarivorans sp.]|nr:DUF799 family lipoprotein [Marinagarivorans sp.]